MSGCSAAAGSAAAARVAVARGYKNDLDYVPLAVVREAVADVAAAMLAAEARVVLKAAYEGDLATLKRLVKQVKPRRGHRQGV